MNKPLSHLGRRVRAGGFSLRAETAVDQRQRDAAATLQAVSRTLATALDELARDELRTPLEKRIGATAAVKKATQQWDAVRSKILDAGAAIHQRIEVLDGVRRQYAAKTDPYTLRRLELRAQQLRERGGAALLNEWKEAEASGDPDRILALSLADPGNYRAADRLFLKVARPQQLSDIDRDLAVQRQLDADAIAFSNGIVELLALDDPHTAAPMTADDMWKISAGDPGAVDPLLPSWLHATEVPA